jgi:hypothetical protein
VISTHVIARSNSFVRDKRIRSVLSWTDGSGATGRPCIFHQMVSVTRHTIIFFGRNEKNEFVLVQNSCHMNSIVVEQFMLLYMSDIK